MAHVLAGPGGLVVATVLPVAQVRWTFGLEQGVGQRDVGGVEQAAEGEADQGRYGGVEQPEGQQRRAPADHCGEGGGPQR